MAWEVEIGSEFKPEFFDLHEDVRTELLALALMLQEFGPRLGRPRVDTLNGAFRRPRTCLRPRAARRGSTGS